MKHKRFRILYTQTTSGGGSELSLYELVRGLDKSIYEPVVLFYWPSPYHELFEEAGAKILTLSDMVPLGEMPPDAEAKSRVISTSWLAAFAPILYRFVRWDLRLAKRVASIIKKENIDIVHNNCSLNMDRAMVLAGLLAKRPQVSHFRQFSRLTFIAKRLIRYVDEFIYITSSIGACYEKQGIPGARGHVIYDPIDTQKSVEESALSQLREELGIGSGVSVICNVGRIVPWKGQDYFLRSVAEVAEEFTNIKILIVGQPGPAAEEQRFEKELRQLTEELGLSGNVIFTGQRSDVSEIMAISDVVVHSAVQPEPFGRVIVEAMVVGRPVVATDAGGVPEIIENRVTGMLVPTANESLMAQAIRDLLRDSKGAVLIGQRARQDVKNRFSISRHAKAIEGIYAVLLNRYKTGLQVPSGGGRG